MGSQTNLASGVLLAVLGVFIVLRSVVKNGEGKTLVDQIIELGGGSAKDKSAASKDTSPIAGLRHPLANATTLLPQGPAKGPAVKAAKKIPKAQTPSPITDPLSGLLGLIP